MKNFFKKYSIQLKLLSTLTVSLIILLIVFYYLIPPMLNYPEGTVGTTFQHELENTDYTNQVLSIGVAIFVVYAIIIFSNTKFLVDIDKKLTNLNSVSKEKIKKIKHDLFTSPYKMYALNIIMPVLVITIVHTATTQSMTIKMVKLILLLFSFLTISAAICLILTQASFAKILEKFPFTNENFKKTTIAKRLYSHMLPLFIVSIVFTSLLGYSRLVVEKGDALFNAYKYKLHYSFESKEIHSLDELLILTNSMDLFNDEDNIFIYTPEYKFIDKNGNPIEQTLFFTKYLNEFSDTNNGRVYEYYGEDFQAAIQNIIINGQVYKVGVYYSVTSIVTVLEFIISLIIILALNFLVLKMFSSTLSTDLIRISDGMSGITEGNYVDLDKKLPLVSNDEIGDLTVAFNKIQGLTRQNIEQIQENQNMLMEKERLASLGQLVGGIAHNLKTPIMSIAGAAEGMNDLVKEYDSSIGDAEVTKEDHHEIAHDMSVWIEKIKTHASYMSDVITAVKGQAVTLSEDDREDNFTLGELVKRVDILMKHELKNALVSLNIKMNSDSTISLKGNVNSMVQVINNMISNSIQAYNGEPNKSIDLIVSSEDNKVTISVQDYGCGIPNSIKDKLFKEMTTTKGKNGTGLGMFMSYSTIRGHFNGNIKFDSEEGKGTRFDIILPL